MRLRRLSLERYGKFTDRVIDFGEAIDGAPDLHIVFGPNEAGKSTAFAGFLDLLFGIEMQSRYNFLHPYETMRVGACLDLSVGPRTLVRVKKPQPTLRDASNQPVPEGLILGELGGLDRAAYRTMFSLDDETLEAGGNSILASNGELGQLLFSASAGLAELSKTLLELRAKADGFTWPNARSGELHQLKAAAALLKQQRDAVDTLASEYSRLSAECKAADSRYQSALAEQAQAQAELAKCRRILLALPRMAELRRLRATLAPFAGLPVPAPGWLAELPELAQAETRHRSETERAEAEVTRLVDAIAATNVDLVALGLAEAPARLKTLEARDLTAELDLPLRRRERARVDGELAGILARLGRQGEAAPGSLQLTALQSAAFDTLIGTRSGIEAQVTAAADELSKALFVLTEARQAVQADSPAENPGSLAPAVAALQALRESNDAVRRRDGERACAQHRDALAAHMAKLAPWSGEIEALAGLVLPDTATLEAWVETATQNAAALTRQRAEVERLDGELAAKADALAAIGQVEGLLTDQAAAEIRRIREAAWAAHRHALDRESADSFEAALRHDDIVGSARLGHERERAKLNEMAQSVLVKRAETERARHLLAEVVSRQARDAGQIAQAAAGISPCLAELSPARLLGWAARRDEALASWRNVLTAERDVSEATADASRLRERLLDALLQAGVPVDPHLPTHAVTDAAQDHIDRASRVQALRQAVTNAELDVRRRELAVQKAATADRTWLAQWRSACVACWLGESAAALPFDAVRGLLAASAELGPVLKERADLDTRIHGMEEDQAAYGQALDQLAASLGMDPGGQARAELAKAALRRVQEAVTADRQVQQLKEDFAKAEARVREVRQAAQAHADRVEGMMNAMQAGTLIELAGKLHDAHQKADLQTQAAAAERAILAALRVDDLGEAEAVLEPLDESNIEVEQGRLAAWLVDLEERTRTLFAANKEASDRIAAIGGDEAAARIEAQRRTHLLDIEEKAGQHLRLRLGIAAADRALRAYRDQHRSAMMTQASEAFSLISRGAYRGLGTQPGRDGDILVALGADGSSKLAADLSKGTRFQLYFALRAAGYREFAKMRPPVPFVADDIMETFDDFRAEETLKVLADMSRLGQVIYLTHHDHLRLLAQRIVPGVRVHDLVA